MSIQKIIGWVALVLAIVGAFTNIPYLAAVLVVVGLVSGWNIAGEDHVRVLASALVLNALSGTLNAIPQAGSHLAAIVSNIGLLVAGAAIIIVLCNIYRRFKP